MNPSYVPTPAQWAAATWHARQSWAKSRTLTLREAQLTVEAGHLTRTVIVTAARRHLDAVYPPTPASTADELAASYAGDRDPVVVAMRRAAASGLALTHPDVTLGLPAAS